MFMRPATRSTQLEAKGPRRAATKGRNAVLVSAIKYKEVLSFFYEGEQRIVEPQTYGISTTGDPVLRARQIGGGSRSGQRRMAKLFNVTKISALKKTGAHFEDALPEHNPDDSAMTRIFASLPRPVRGKLPSRTPVRLP
jgi:hypothetical protein